MVIAVPIVGMMQMTVDQVIHVIAMGYRRVPAAGSMDVTLLMSGTAMRQATFGVFGTDFDAVFVVVITVRAMKVAVVEITDVIAVANRNMAAVRSMLMLRVRMRLVVHAFRSRASGGWVCVGIGVINDVANQRLDVVISQPVVHVTTRPAPGHQVLAEQHSETLRRRRHLGAGLRGNVGHLPLAA